MSRTQMFAVAIVAAIVLVVVGILAWTGAMFGHHHDGPLGLQNFKHGVLFVGLAIVALIFAAATRPMKSIAPSKPE